MRNALNLGKFEYGSRAKWSPVIVVCCLLMVLMFPAVAEAGNQITRTFNRITSRQFTNITGNRFVHARLFARNNASNNVLAVAFACGNPWGWSNNTVAFAQVRPTPSNRQMNADAAPWVNARWRGSAQPSVNGRVISASVTVARR